MRGIRGSVAVVTGAGSGIGRALAVELASAGAQLAIADVNSAGLDETREIIGPAMASSAVARTYVLDVSDVSAVEAFARQVERDFDRVSLLINNAGVALMGTFAEVSLADMEWLFKINYWGVVYGCKFFMPMLEREPEAHIVNISSLFGLVAPPGQAAYASSKFAVRGFTEALRLELENTNIRVTCVHPGGIRTEIAEKARAGAGVRAEIAAENRERFKKLAPTTPETAAKVIMKGILGNKPRVLIGADARQIDRFQRLMPARAASMLASFVEKRAPSQPSPAKAGDNPNNTR
jgi:NAD(P)-dependent dehydrogenase (short-subunit alcohol dehydrogenase family)